MDMCGFPKDGFYFYQSQWTDEPMLHHFPHWTWPGREGEVLPVLDYTNCDSVELFVNGRSWGVKSYVSAHWGLDRSRTYSEQSHSPPVWPTTADLHLSRDVSYEPGTLRGIGRKDGEVVCVHEIVTAGEAAQVDVGADPGESHVGGGVGAQHYPGHSEPIDSSGASGSTEPSFQPKARARGLRVDESHWGPGPAERTCHNIVKWTADWRFPHQHIMRGG